MQTDGSRALRTLVAEMAQLGEGDLLAILDDLDAGSRARLMALIEAFRRGEGSVGPSADLSAGGGLPGDWLLARLKPRDPATSDMTPHAFKVLRRVALESGWTDTAAVVAGEPGQRGLLARLGIRP